MKSWTIHRSPNTESGRYLPYDSTPLPHFYK